MSIKYENANAYSLPKIFLITLRSVFISILFTVLALFLLAVLVTYGPVSEGAVDICVKVATLVSVFFASILGAGKIKNRGWLVGVITSVTYFLVMISIKSLTLQGSSFSSLSFDTILLCIVFGIIGGIVGVNIKK